MQQFTLLKVQNYILNIIVKTLLFKKFSSTDKIRKKVFLRYEYK